MGEIKDFVELYIDNLDILEDTANKISMDLQNNIKKQLYPGHGYDQGRLKRSIRVDSRIHDKYAIITGYYDEGLAPHGIFVLRGIRGKGKAKSGPIDFKGLITFKGNDELVVKNKTYTIAKNNTYWTIVIYNADTCEILPNQSFTIKYANLDDESFVTRNNGYFTFVAKEDDFEVEL